MKSIDTDPIDAKQDARAVLSRGMKGFSGTPAFAAVRRIGMTAELGNN